MFPSLNWIESDETILKECGEVFEKKYDEGFNTGNNEELLDQWYELAGRRPFIAFILLGRIVKDLDERIRVENKLNETLKNHFEIDRLSDYLSIILVSEKSIPETVFNYVKWLNKADQVKLCQLIFSNIELLDDREEKLLKILDKLDKYELFDMDCLEDSLSGFAPQYDKHSSCEVYSNIKQFLVDHVTKSNFILTNLVIEFFNYSYEELLDSIEPEDIIKYWSAVDEKNTFAGAIMYLRFMEIDGRENDGLLVLETWYRRICEIKTEAMYRALNGLYWIYLCKALQNCSFEYKNDPELIIERMTGKELEKLEIPVITKEDKGKYKEYKKEYILNYRKAIFVLLMNGNVEFSNKFIKKTTGRIDIDKYSSRKGMKRLSENTIRKSLRQELSCFDENSLVRRVVDSDCTVDDKIYVFFNTFLRGIISYSIFVNDIFRKHGSAAFEQLGGIGYGIGATARVFDNKNKIVVNPITVKEDLASRWIIDLNSVNEVSKVLLSKKSFWTEICPVSYTNSRKHIVFRVVKFDQNYDVLLNKLEHFLKTNNKDYFLDSIVMNYPQELIYPYTDRYNDLSIIILKLLIKSASNEQNLYTTIKWLENINYYAYKRQNITRVDYVYLGEKKLEVIKKCWRQMYDLSLSVGMSLSIYLNTVLRCYYSFSGFVKAFVNPENYSDLSTVFYNYTFGGEIISFDKTENCYKIIVKPIEFIINKNDVFMAIVDSYGNYAEYFEEELSLCTSGTKQVVFELDSFDGNGGFIVKNMKMFVSGR